MAEHPPVEGWTPPTASERKRILDRSTARERQHILNRSRSVAVVGASSSLARASYFVLTYLLSSSTDYDVYSR